jgi:hypothetical protein
MSTLNVSTIIPDEGTNTDLDLSGKGTGRPDLQAGFKVGGTAGVPTASIRDDAITSAKIADDAVVTAAIADDAVVTAAIADDAITAALMADDAVGVAQLSATGTASASNFLRGDNTWAAAGGGKILQVVSVFNNDYATHSNTNCDSPAEIVNVSITPSATSSKILMLGHFTGASDSGDVQWIGVSLYRNSIHIGYGDNTSRNSAEGIYHTGHWRDDHYSKPGSSSITFMDSPMSTSSITYRLKAFANHFGSSLSNLTLIQNSGGYNYASKEQGVGTTTLILMEIGA